MLTDYLLSKTRWVVEGMRVFPERMSDNLRASKGLIFSGQLLLDLSEAGMLREEAYRVVQGHAMRSWETGEDFRTSVEDDPAVTRWLAGDQLDATFSPDRHLRHVDDIFRRVFGR